LVALPNGQFGESRQRATYQKIGEVALRPFVTQTSTIIQLNKNKKLQKGFSNVEANLFFGGFGLKIQPSATIHLYLGQRRDDRYWGDGGYVNRL